MALMTVLALILIAASIITAYAAGAAGNRRSDDYGGFTFDILIVLPWLLAGTALLVMR